MLAMTTDKKKFSDQGSSQSRAGAGASPLGETTAVCWA
jgi:hypothetical protein